MRLQKLSVEDHNQFPTVNKLKYQIITHPGAYCELEQTASRMAGEAEQGPAGKAAVTRMMVADFVFRADRL